jgi:hypothetical protein
MKVHAAARLVQAETIQNYVQRLKKLGIRRIGGGEYGLVFQHPTLPDVVVKLLVEKDPDYMSWVQFSQKHQDNPYVPKIFNVSQDKNRFDPEMFKRFGSSNLLDMHLIFMEKLKPVTMNEYKKFGTHLADLANGVARKDAFMWKHIRDTPILWSLLSKQKEDLALAEVAKFISDGHAGMLDVHEGNVMKRGAQVVIIDPFAS